MTDKKIYEHELINRFVKADSKKAFEELMSMYKDRVFRFGARMCGHREDAEDVLQETLLSAYRNMDSFRGEGSFQSWLFKIASSACLKKRRKRKHEPGREESLDQLVEDREDRIPAGTPDGADGPVHEAEAGELARRLQSALLGLPPIYRVVITLRDFEGLSTEETAKVLDISTTAAKVRLHRARTMLQKHVDCYDADKVGEDCG
ncbi:MAG: RNA polymerase sigma factor [Pseudomonadota bacterium]